MSPIDWTPGSKDDKPPGNPYKLGSLTQSQHERDNCPQCIEEAARRIHHPKPGELKDWLEMLPAMIEQSDFEAWWSDVNCIKWSDKEQRRLTREYVNHVRTISAAGFREQFSKVQTMQDGSPVNNIHSDLIKPFLSKGKPKGLRWIDTV